MSTTPAEGAALFGNMDEVVQLTIPTDLLTSSEGQALSVEITPLNVQTFQLIAKAGKNEPSLIPLLMVKEAVVSPRLELKDIKKMKVGLVHYLVQEIKQLSGLR